MFDITPLLKDVGIKHDKIKDIKILYSSIHKNSAIIRDDLVEILEWPRSSIYDMIKVLFYKNVINKLSIPQTSRGRPLIYFSTVEDVLFKTKSNNLGCYENNLDSIVEVCSGDALSLEQIEKSTSIPPSEVIPHLPNACFINKYKPEIDHNPLEIVIPRNIFKVISARNYKRV